MEHAERKLKKMNLELKIVLGHKICKNLKPTIEGHTHDWSLSLKGVNGNEIKHVVEKVIFHLPDDYPDPKRIKEKPPFVLSESTSRSFSMDIDVFFCAGAGLNKVHYVYDLSISNEEINTSWEKSIKFSNPSKDFKEKLLLAGGKVVDNQQTSDLNGAVLKCKDEPVEAIEIIEEVGNENASNSVIEEIDNLQVLLEENEDLRVANVEVKEKTNIREKLLSFYEEKLSSCETSILTTNMGIVQLKKKIETDEKEISTLKLQAQLLLTELSEIKKLSTKKLNENIKGKKRKRKAKEHLSIATPVEKKRRNIIQPVKIQSSPSIISQSSKLPEDLSVRKKRKNNCESVLAKRSTLVIQKSKSNETDTFLNNSNNTLSRNLHSQSDDEIQCISIECSPQRNSSGGCNSENLDNHKNESFASLPLKAGNVCDGKTFVNGGSIKEKSYQNSSKTANNNAKKSAKGSSAKCKVTKYSNSVIVKEGTSAVQNSKSSKTDTILNDSSVTSVGNQFHSQSINKLQPTNDLSSFQQDISKGCSLGNSEKHRNESFVSLPVKSENACYRSVTGDTVTVIYSPNISEIANNGIKTPVKENSTKADADVIKFCESVKSKRNSSAVQKSTPEKSDTVLNNSNDTSSRSCLNSQLHNKTQCLNNNSSLQQNISGQYNPGNSENLKEDSLASFSIKTENAGGSKKSVNRPTVEVESQNASEIANNGLENLSEGSSTKTNVAIKAEPRVSDCEKLAHQSLMEIDCSLYVPETKNDVQKPTNEISKQIDSSLCATEIKNIDVEKPMYQSLMEIDSSLPVHKIRGNGVKETAAEISKEIDSSLCVTNNDVEKSTHQRSMDIDSSFCAPEIINTDVEKAVERNLVAFDTSLINSEIRINDVEEQVRINNAQNPLKRTLNKTDGFLHETETKGSNVCRISEVAIPCNKFEITNDDAVKLIEKSPSEAHAAVDVDAVRFINGNYSSNHNNFHKKCTESGTESLQEKLNDLSNKEQFTSSPQITDPESFNSNHKESNQMHSKFIDNNFSSVTRSNKKFPKRKKNPILPNSYLQSCRNVFPCKNVNNNTVYSRSHQDINCSYEPTLMELMSDNCQELGVELDRLENSQFSKFRYKTNPLFYKLGEIDRNITQKYLMRYIRSITEFFTSPKTSYDMPTIIYLVVNYLSCSKIKHTSILPCSQNEDLYLFLPNSEKCVIAALHEVERMSLPHLNGLIRNILNIIHRVIVSKKRMAVNGLVSLCRVFMDLCSLRKDRWEPLFLSCELLRLGHPLAPYLICSLASVWRDPFYLLDEFSVEEKILLSSIIYGIKEKPLLMDSNLWNLTCRLSSICFPQPVIVDPHEAIEILTANIISRCNKGQFNDIWILTSPLNIFILYQAWDWKIYFRNKFITPNLLYYSRCLNEGAFEVFCNLYVEICSLCNESPYEELLPYFSHSTLYEGKPFGQECTAIALLKYIITTDRPVPAPLRFWFVRNKNYEKLKPVVDLYCKIVMESQDNRLLWDDIIVL